MLPTPQSRHCATSIVKQEFILLNLKMKHTKFTLGAFFVACQLVACGGGGDNQSADEDVKASSTTQIVSETKTLVEGVQLSYTLSAGTYMANITSSNNGVIVSWPGGTNCQTSSETKVYSASCTFAAQGQIVISNPTTFGLGGSVGDKHLN
jgi:hypothetical protein